MEKAHDVAGKVQGIGLEKPQLICNCLVTWTLHGIKR